MKFEDPSKAKTTGGVGMVVGSLERLIVVTTSLVVGAVGVVGGVLSKEDCCGVSRKLGDGAA